MLCCLYPALLRVDHLTVPVDRPLPSKVKWVISPWQMNLCLQSEFPQLATPVQICVILLSITLSLHFTEGTSLFLSKTCILAPSHPIPPPRGLSPSQTFSLHTLLAFLTHHVSMICSYSKCVFQEASLCWEKFLKVF